MKSDKSSFGERRGESKWGYSTVFAVCFCVLCCNVWDKERWWQQK